MSSLRTALACRPVNTRVMVVPRPNDLRQLTSVPAS